MACDRLFSVRNSVSSVSRECHQLGSTSTTSRNPEPRYWGTDSSMTMLAVAS